MILSHGAVVAVVDGAKFELYRNSRSEVDPTLSSLEAPIWSPTTSPPERAGIRARRIPRGIS